MDKLFGGADSDWLFGEAGGDYLYGEGGNDFLVGGRDWAVDAYYGGAGSDVFYFPAQVVAGTWYFSEHESIKDGSSLDGIVPWFGA